MDTLGKIFRVNFPGYTDWFWSIRTSKLKDHSISEDQDRYATSVVVKYIHTATIKKNQSFTRLLYLII